MIIKFFSILFFLLFLVVSPAGAELYKFTDSDGKIHFVDDIHKIPEEYRRDAGEVETRPLNIIPAKKIEERSPKTSTDNSEGLLPPEMREEYGDHQLIWWDKTIKNLRKRVASAEESYNNMNDYISVFENGRRWGKIFKEDEIKRYEEYKELLAGEEKNLKEAKKELSKLISKARRAGVPRNIRGD